MRKSADVLIIGAGVSGLTAALLLQRAGKSVLVVEKEKSVGGRTRTMHIDGFQLDLGFQVFLPAYPECKRLLNYEKLQLRPLASKALIRYQNSFLRVGDPMRHPEILASLLRLPVLSLKDLASAVKLRASLAITPSKISPHPNAQTTCQFLQQLGFSNDIRRTIIEPFLRGVFLDSNLETPASQARFVLKMFAEGGTALPQQGIQAIPNLLAADLKQGSVALETEIVKLQEHEAQDSYGNTYQFQNAIVTDAEASRALLKDHEPVEFYPCQTLYFEAQHKNLPEQLVLNPEAGIDEIHHLLVPSRSIPNYAPQGRHLISATVLHPHIESEAINKCHWQLESWFGKFQVLNHLKTITIPRALPKLSTGERTLGKTTAIPGIFRSGDFVQDSSLNGAFTSARIVVETILGTQSKRANEKTCQ